MPAFSHRHEYLLLLVAFIFFSKLLPPRNQNCFGPSRFYANVRAVRPDHWNLARDGLYTNVHSNPTYCHNLSGDHRRKPGSAQERSSCENGVTFGSCSSDRGCYPQQFNFVYSLLLLFLIPRIYPRAVICLRSHGQSLSTKKRERKNVVVTALGQERGYLIPFRKMHHNKLFFIHIGRGRKKKREI